MTKKNAKKQPDALGGSISKLIKKFRDNDPKVAVLRLDGVISSGNILTKAGLNLEDLEEDIEKAFSLSKKIKAVALQVNSPGGSPVQSELLCHRIRQLSKEKKVPVYAFAEDVAASGGYWLLCASDEIYAMPSSIVGSIGVVSSGFGFAEAIKKVGVERRVYTQGKNKAVLDPFQKENPESVRIIKSIQKDVHAGFMDMVRERRKGKIKKKDEDSLFSGEFWTGTQGKALGLVDEIGDMRSVMREKFGKNVKFIKIQKPKGWLRRKLGFLGSSLAGGAIEELNAKIMWSRFGL